MIHELSVLVWNLNHRTNERQIPENAMRALEALAADLVVFNEFVDGPTRSSFRARLVDLGYPYLLVSPTSAKHNQVFAASRFPVATGDLQAPSLDGAAASNFLHLSIVDSEIEVVGLRVPAYMRVGTKRQYWQELAAVLRSARDRAIVVAGDFNVDPFAPQRIGARTPPLAAVDGFSFSNPIGLWSYVNSNATRASRIDHVMHSPRLRIDGTRYVDRVGDVHLAGPKHVTPISDHAALVFNVSYLPVTVGERP